MRTLLCCLLALGMASAARGDFSLNIDGPGPSTPTDWILGGSGTATATYMGNYFEYTGVGAFFPMSSTTFPPTGGTATLSNPATASTANITSVTLSNANGGTIGFNLSTFLVVNSGNTVSASSSAWKFSVPKSSLSSLGLPYQTLDKATSSGLARLDLGIGGPSSVPEAGAIPVLCGVLGSAYAGWSWLRGRRRH